MIDVKRGLLRTVFGLALSTFAIVPTSAPARSNNPLLSAPMPKCGPSDFSFQRLLDDLKQRRSWEGTHENTTGVFELTIGRNGSWFLFFHSRDGRERKLVCLIARGSNSREFFGRPV